MKLGICKLDFSEQGAIDFNVCITACLFSIFLGQPFAVSKRIVTAFKCIEYYRRAIDLNNDGPTPPLISTSSAFGDRGHLCIEHTAKNIQLAESDVDVAIDLAGIEPMPGVEDERDNTKLFVHLLGTTVHKGAHSGLPY